MDADGPDNTVSTFEDNDYHLRENSDAINTADPIILNANPDYFPEDIENVDGDGSATEATPELDLAERVYVDPGNANGATRMDVGAYEAPCFIEEGCGSDCVTSETFADPPDGKVDAADLAFLLGEWGSPAPNSPTCADKVTSATFAPPPDGNVDAADLAYLLGSWGWCCDFSGGGEGLMGGGEGGGYEEGSLGPYAGTYLGLLLEELMATNDSDLVEVIQALLQEGD